MLQQGDKARHKMRPNQMCNVGIKKRFLAVQLLLLLMPFVAQSVHVECPADFDQYRVVKLTHPVTVDPQSQGIKSMYRYRAVKQDLRPNLLGLFDFPEEKEKDGRIFVSSGSCLAEIYLGEEGRLIIEHIQGCFPPARDDQIGSLAEKIVSEISGDQYLQDRHSCGQPPFSRMLSCSLNYQLHLDGRPVANGFAWVGIEPHNGISTITKITIRHKWVRDQELSLIDAEQARTRYNPRQSLFFPYNRPLAASTCKKQRANGTCDYDSPMRYPNEMQLGYVDCNSHQKQAGFLYPMFLFTDTQLDTVDNQPGRSRSFIGFVDAVR